MLDLLPSDRRALILSRLGRDRITVLEKKYSELITEPSKLAEIDLVIAGLVRAKRRVLAINHRA